FDKAPRAQNIFLNRGPNPPHCIGGKAEAPLRFELLDRLHQAHISFGDHLTDRQAIAAISHGNLGHEPQMAGYELMGGIGIAMLMVALGEHIFFFRLKHGETADFLKVTCKSAFTGYYAW